MMNRRPEILYVEDDNHLSFVTKDNLEMKGYSITVCKTGREARATFRKKTFDLCILDVMLPGVDGFTLAKEFRALNHDIPIIFLSAKSMKEDRIEGLLAGGDDYITKPYSIEELSLKIEVFLKRNKITGGAHPDKNIFKLGNYTFNYRNLQLTHEGTSSRLTQREADLLKFMAENLNNVIKKEEILHEIWGNDSYFNSRSLDVFISRLRKHLAKDPTVHINNMHGIGFILVTE
ncbi:MAG: response regulator transcription factor [Bacteroidales bacterium]